MAKNYLRIFSGILSAGISQLLCYFFIDDLFVRFITTIPSALCLRLLIAIWVYIAIIWVSKNPIYKIEKDILFFGYLLFCISVSIFRYKMIYYRSMNFNVFDIVNNYKSIIFYNILIYIPFGFYLGSRSKLKILYNLFIFIAYIVIIELLQHYLKVGIFDINDILLNCLGFLIGSTVQRTAVRLPVVKTAMNKANRIKT